VSPRDVEGLIPVRVSEDGASLLDLGSLLAVMVMLLMLMMLLVMRLLVVAVDSSPLALAAPRLLLIDSRAA